MSVLGCCVCNKYMFDSSMYFSFKYFFLFFPSRYTQISDREWLVCHIVANHSSTCIQYRPSIGAHNRVNDYNRHQLPVHWIDKHTIRHAQQRIQTQSHTHVHRIPTAQYEFNSTEACQSQATQRQTRLLRPELVEEQESLLHATNRLLWYNQAVQRPFCHYYSKQKSSNRQQSEQYAKLVVVLLSLVSTQCGHKNQAQRHFELHIEDVQERRLCVLTAIIVIHQKPDQVTHWRGFQQATTYRGHHQ